MIVRGLTARTRKRLGAQAQDAAERLIASEAMALHGLWLAAEGATARLQARASRFDGEDGDRLALGAVLEEAARLDAETRQATALARARARRLAEGAVAGELAVIRSWSEREGAGATVPEPAPAPEPERDLFAALAVAASVVAAFRSRAASALQNRPEAVSRAAALAAAFPEAKLRLNASVIAAEAYQAGRKSAWQSVLAQVPAPALRDPYRVAAPAPAPDLPLPGGRPPPPATGPGDTGPETRLPYGWLAGTFRVWSAILDRRTCPVCSSADGTMVPAGTPWPEGREIPLHTRCRCVELSVFIPEAHAAKLPGMQLDYDALKADVRDYFRGSSLNVPEGRRHVGGFIRDTMQEGSPKALTRRLYEDRSNYAAPPPRPNRSLSVEGSKPVRRQIIVPAPGTAYPNEPTAIERPPGAPRSR